MQMPLVSSRLAECEYIIEKGLNTFVEVGMALLEIRDNRLYKDSYSTFEEYCRERWGMVASRARQLIASAEVVGSLQTVTNVTLLPANEAQARPLAGLPADTQMQVWQQVVKTAPEGKITGDFVQKVVDRIARPENIHVSDDSYEWYTPEEYIEAARAVMGKIDLDPASCKEANEVVGAKKYYSQKEDGLNQEWYGKVWLNPPYNMPDVQLFTSTADSLYKSGEVEEAIILVNNATDAGWFHDLLSKYPVCLTRGRVKYWGPHASQARQGQAIFYLGKNINLFKKEFSKFGLVLRLL